MEFPALVEGVLLKRYKRFLADIELDDGRIITAHCPNTGAMTGCAEPGSRVWLSVSDNPKRKYRHSWELVETAGGYLACIHSARANALAEEAIERGVIKELQGYQSLRREVRFGEEGSRIDILLEQAGGPSCYVEVKSVTLLLEQGLGVFPDAVSDRGRKHLRELATMALQGQRAVLLFAVLHKGIDRVAPADQIDARYGEAFREAIQAGVEVLAYQAQITATQISLQAPLKVLQRQPA